nr:uncharacterized protein LOC117833755 [Setaria viridis]
MKPGAVQERRRHRAPPRHALWQEREQSMSFRCSPMVVQLRVHCHCHAKSRRGSTPRPHAPSPCRIRLPVAAPRTASRWIRLSTAVPTVRCPDPTRAEHWGGAPLRAPSRGEAAGARRVVRSLRGRVDSSSERNLKEHEVHGGGGRRPVVRRYVEMVVGERRRRLRTMPRPVALGTRGSAVHRVVVASPSRWPAASGGGTPAKVVVEVRITESSASELPAARRIGKLLAHPLGAREEIL